jgi:hypothetical protein
MPPTSVFCTLYYSLELEVLYQAKPASSISVFRYGHNSQKTYTYSEPAAGLQLVF